MGAINAVHKYRVRHHAREGIFKGNRRFPLERRFFWYAEPVRARRLSLEKEKYIKTNKQINPNLKTTE